MPSTRSSLRAGNGEHRPAIREEFKRGLGCDRNTSYMLIREQNKLSNLQYCWRIPARVKPVSNNDGILNKIVNLALAKAVNLQTGQDDELRRCRTLSELHEKLNDMKQAITRSGNFFQLLSKEGYFHEGTRYLNSAPLWLNIKTHIDSEFCGALISDLEMLATILGSDQVIFLSHDATKSRIKMQPTEASSEAPYQLHLEYGTNPSGNQLAVSIYTLNIIRPTFVGTPSAVSHSGPSYIEIKSDGSSFGAASTHATDFRKLLSIRSFKKVMENKTVVKPIVIISLDGNAEQNPKSPSVMRNALEIFSTYDLDGLFIYTNAPGLHGDTHVDRKIVSLRRGLDGVIISFDGFESHHLDNGEIGNVEREMSNIGIAGDVLANVWSKTVIDGYQVSAEHVTQSTVASLMKPLGKKWLAEHVRESEYLLQIVKCGNSECCKKPRSGLRSLVHDGFLPPPYSIVQTPTSLEARATRSGRFSNLLLRIAVEKKPKHPFFIMPYDYSCPSARSKIVERICTVCGLYFTSKEAVVDHEIEIHQ